MGGTIRKPISDRGGRPLIVTRHWPTSLATLRIAARAPNSQCISLVRFRAKRRRITRRSRKLRAGLELEGKIRWEGRRDLACPVVTNKGRGFARTGSSAEKWDDYYRLIRWLRGGGNDPIRQIGLPQNP